MRLRHLILCCFTLFAFPSFSQTTDTIVVLDASASFPGGDAEFNKYWNKNYRVPKRLRLTYIEGYGEISYTIAPDGTVQDAFVKKLLHPELDAIALATVQNMPRWSPAIYQGKPVAITYTMSYYHQNTQSSFLRVSHSEFRKNQIKHRFGVGLWTGTMATFGDFTNYRAPFAPLIGIGMQYGLKKMEFILEYDITGSRVNNSFDFAGEQTVEGERFTAVNFYMPICYLHQLNDRWQAIPYIAPTINLYGISSPSREENKTTLSETVYSISSGIRFRRYGRIKEYKHNVG